METQILLKLITQHGAEKTLSNIESIKDPILRFRNRRHYEQAFKLLKICDERFKTAEFPVIS